MDRRRFLRWGAPLLSIGALKPEWAFSKKRLQSSTWHIEPFFDKGLAQFTYAIISDDRMILIDPARDPSPFYKYAQEQQVTITDIIETHPHADFVSSHTEIARKTGCNIHVSEKLEAKYKHHGLKDGDILPLNADIQLKILDTPGHSPDSISILLQEKGRDKIVFTGDALLFGDVGRPDLREYGHRENEQRTFLAGQLYHTVKNKFAPLSDDVVVHPAHGAGSLCGNTTHNVSSSTIGYERSNNHAFQHKSEKEFVEYLLANLPFVPQYFPYDVEINRSGAKDLTESISKINFLPDNHIVEKGSIVVDVRPKPIFENSYFPGALNIQDGTKFETWLGTVVKPSETFYVIGEKNEALQTAISKLAKIGYETHIAGAFIYDKPQKIPVFLEGKVFRIAEQSNYTILDVRNENEYKEGKLISTSINIPLPALAKKKQNIPTDKPIIVHCASGYRSAIAASILRSEYPNVQILDLGEDILKVKTDINP